MVNKMDFTSLIKATINTINNKKTLTPNVRQQALRFYFYCQDNRDDMDEASKSSLREYEYFLREKGILIR